VASDGALTLDLAHAELRYSKPICVSADRRRATPRGGGRPARRRRVTFEAGAYDRSRELVIDPVLVLGPLVHFARDGDQTIGVQTREDGLSIDQIVLSGERYLMKAPGATKNDTTIVER